MLQAAAETSSVVFWGTTTALDPFSLGVFGAGGTGELVEGYGNGG